MKKRRYPECPNDSCYFGNDGRGFRLERIDNEYKCPNCGNSVSEALLIQIGWSRDVLHRDPTKWWLISDEDVQAIRNGLTGSLLHTLSSGLHTTDEIPEDWKTDE